MPLRILYQDPDLVAVEKPSGFHVHPPEDKRHKISDRVNCLHIVRNQLDQFLYPVHRLDRATSGVLVFALNSETANHLNRLFQKRQVSKTYYCVCRGWTNPEGLIDHALDEQESQTRYQTLAKVELPIATRRYENARYSLVRVQPLSGRMHQIRRHFAHISHHLIGDTVYGDGEHNRLFREKFLLDLLLLKSFSIEFEHPKTASSLKIKSRWGGDWHRVFDIFGVCPIF